MLAYPDRLTTPSWIRAPPESLIPMHGRPARTARSITLHTFSAKTSPSEPPKTLASCEKMKMSRPSTAPYPVTTPSPGTFFSPIPNASVRWTAKASSSVKDPGSTRSSMRSRAVSLPFGCCLSSGSPPRCIASYFRFRRMLIWRSEGDGAASFAARVAMDLAASPRPVLAKHAAQHVTHLSYGGIGPQRLSHRGKQVRCALRGPAHLCQRRPDAGRVAFGPKPLERRDLLALMFGTDLDDLDGLVIAAEAVDADHHPPAILDRLLESVCALLDGILREPGLDRLDRATPPVHLVDQRPGARFQLGGQRLHQVAPTQRIGDARHIGLVRADLLRSHRDG